MNGQQRHLRLTVKDGVANFLRDAIFQGKLNPGDRIVEIKWAKELGVAQASVREALHKLETEGFVERRPNRGTYVTVLSADGIRHIYAIRAVLEALAVELFTERAQPEAIDSLQRRADEMAAAAVVGDVQGFYARDLAFHRNIWECSGNPLLPGVLGKLVIPLFAFIIMRVHASPEVGHDLVHSAAVHQKIVGIIKERDPQAAAALMRQTIHGFRDETAALLDRHRGKLDGVPPAARAPLLTAVKTQAREVV